MTTDFVADVGREIAQAAAMAWQVDKKGGEPETPTEEDLAQWLTTTWDTEALETANAKLLEAVKKDNQRGGRGYLHEEDDFRLTLPEALWCARASRLRVLLWYRFESGPKVVDHPSKLTLKDLLVMLEKFRRRPRLYHWKEDDSPLLHFVRAWQGRPLPVASNTAPRRILPRNGIVIERQTDRYGQMTLFPQFVRRGPGRQLYLPVNPSDRGPALPYHLYGLGDQADHITHGPAPLPARLFLESLLQVPYDKRNINRPVALQMTLRDVRTALWPRSAKTMPTSRVQEALIKAAGVLDSWDTAIPWVNQKTGESGLRRVVIISDIGATLDDKLRVIVDLPDGSQDGPLMPANLNAWGARSAICWRILLGLSLRWHEPNHTLSLTSAGRHWVHKPDDDTKAWPNLSDDDLLNLAYPHLGGGTGRMRRNRLRQAIDALKLLAKEGDLRIVEGRRILPPTTEGVL